MKYLLYRISTNSRNNQPFGCVDKYLLLLNNLKKFDDFHVIVIADNCTQDILEDLKRIEGVTVQITSLGNTLSFLYALNLACKLQDEDFVYFCEDDYFHEDQSAQTLIKGSHYFDYVSLYAHPDKYPWTNFKEKSLYTSDLFSEETRLIYLGASDLWRTTGSTTMTFATYVHILKKDIGWWKVLIGRNQIPNDHRAWIFLTAYRPALNLKFSLQYLKYYFYYLSAILFGPRRRLGIPFRSISLHLDKSSIGSNILPIEKINEICHKIK